MTKEQLEKKVTELEQKVSDLSESNFAKGRKIDELRNARWKVETELNEKITSLKSKLEAKEEVTESSKREAYDIEALNRIIIKSNEKIKSLEATVARLGGLSESMIRSLDGTLAMGKTIYNDVAMSLVQEGDE